MRAKSVFCSSRALSAEHCLVQYPADVTADDYVLPLDDDSTIGGTGLAGLAIETQQTYNLQDVAGDSRVNPLVDFVPGLFQDVTTILCIPFASVASGELLGVCEVFNKCRTATLTAHAFMRTNALSHSIGVSVVACMAQARWWRL